MEKQPNPEEVKLLMNYTYLFYKKYIAEQKIDWNQFRNDYIELSKKYPYDLTVKILEELIQIIGKQKGGL